MSNKKTAVVDLDWCKYTVAGVAEKRTVIVTNKATGKTQVHKTKTDFWGRGNKIGGVLEHINDQRIEEGLEPFTKDDFEIEQVRTPEPIENALHTAKKMVEGALEQSGAEDVIFVMGEGDGFRLDLSTMKKYKDRTADKPILLGEVTDYLKKKYKPEIVTDIEADDLVTILCYKQPNRYVVGEDKDNYSQPVRFFNVNRPEEGIVDCNGFGELNRVDKKIRGKGRLHLYWQIAWGDPVDNYKANACSEIKWGEVKAYEKLVGCKDDKEALLALKEVYQYLYPEPVEATSWQGNPIVVDWKYALNECWHMARMLRTWDELENKIHVWDVFDNLGIDYE